MAVKCPKCNFDNPENTNFCGKCATPLASSPGEDVSQTRTLEAPRAELAVGSIFAGRYLIVEELGRGGMGRVYRAIDKKLKEEVALKLIRPEIATETRTLERFHNELKLARKISHPNIGRMYELLEVDDLHFITMEYVPGEDLKSSIRRFGPLPIGKSISIAKQICEGLAAAHMQGVIHRDLKPSNIMIDKEGNAKILDFGIARSLKSKGITAEGMAVGTPEYMSPEQVEGEEVDQRADIYSFGIIIYEMVTGRAPFEGIAPLGVAVKHMTETPKPPKYYRPQLAEALNQLVLKCLEKNRDERYQNVGQIIEDLIPISKGGETSQLSAPRRRLLRRKFLGLIEKEQIKAKKRWLRLAFKTGIFLLLIYLLALFVGVINDLIYRSKLTKIEIEHDTFYKNYFPIQKTWVPAKLVMEGCNALNTYKQVLATRFDDNGKERPKQELDNDPYYVAFKGIAKNFKDFIDKLQYDSIAELQNFRDRNEKQFAYLNELYEASRCSKISASDLFIKNPDFIWNGVYALRYTEFAMIDARLDFLNDRFDQGLKKVHLLLLFIFDLRYSSKNLTGDLISLACFKTVYKDLVILMLAKKEIYSLDSFREIVELSKKILDQINIKQSCYKEYLWAGKISVSYNLIRENFGMNRATYFFLGRFAAWKYGFSFYRAFYQEVKLDKELFEGTKYIKNYREKSLYLRDFRSKVEADKSWGLGTLFPNWPSAAFRQNIARMFIKMFILVHYINLYGLDSKEVLQLKGTELFINEFSGNPFVVIEQNKELSVVLDEKFQLSLKKIDYRNDHKKILLLLKHFDPPAMEDFKSLFYSFEIE